MNEARHVELVLHSYPERRVDCRGQSIGAVGLADPHDRGRLTVHLDGSPLDRVDGMMFAVVVIAAARLAIILMERAA